MKGLFNTMFNAWRVPELRKKLLFTLFILALYMIGGLIPTPGLDAEKFHELVQGWGQIDLCRWTLFGNDLCHGYYPLHQLFHYYAVVDGCNSCP